MVIAQIHDIYRAQLCSVWWTQTEIELRAADATPKRRRWWSRD
jgi:hypothetical protein